MVPPMADEFYEKYKHLSHQELYRMLHSGSVRQSDSVGDTWGSIASTLSGLAGSLRQDMDQLLTAMAGNASQDVLEGISALAKRAKLLSEEATSMRTGLTAMVQALAAAQRQAEAPQEIPAAATTAVSSVLGAEVGHVPTPEELARARERMVWLVARLAAQYGIAEHANWPALTALPVAIAAGAQVIHQGHGRDDRHHRRHGTRLQGTGDLVRQRIQQPSFLSPYSGHGGTSPLGLGYTSAEAAGVLRSGAGVTRTPGVHIVGGGGAPVVPMPNADAPGAAAAAPAAGAAPPPPVGLGGAGMAQSGPVLGGSGAPGMSGPGGLVGGHGLAGEVTWQSADNVEWMDPDDAAPPVIGG